MCMVCISIHKVSNQLVQETHNMLTLLSKRQVREAHDLLNFVFETTGSTNTKCRSLKTVFRNDRFEKHKNY